MSNRKTKHTRYLRLSVNVHKEIINAAREKVNPEARSALGINGQPPIALARLWGGSAHAGPDQFLVAR